MDAVESELDGAKRREVFAALVKAQDDGLGVKKSRAAVAAQFGIDAGTVAEVEDEGLDGNWPPLGKG